MNIWTKPIFTGQRSKKALKWLFIMLHFVGGFFVLWLAYYYLQLLLEGPLTDNLLVKSLLETSYLVAGVAWGNIGWDRLNAITPKTSASDISKNIIFTTAPISIIVPGILLVSELVFRVSEGGWSWAWYHFSVSTIWGVVVVISLIFAYRKYVTGKSSSQAAPAGTR
ncbi:membrane hypothetical protein [Alteromonas infernus]